MPRLVLLSIVLVALALGASRWVAFGNSAWTSVGPSLESRSYSVLTPTSRIPIHAFRTTWDRLDLVVGESRSAEAWRRGSKARVAINGGYFDEGMRPLGLRVAGGKRTSKLREANWGVFYIRQGRAQIKHTRDYQPSRHTQVALQCGPRLVVDGKTTDLKPQWARRSGIGIDRNGRVILAVADGEMSFQQWAEQWASPEGLNCKDALNLDGGGSTQLAFGSSGKELSVSGLWSVPDALIMK